MLFKTKTMVVFSTGILILFGLISFLDAEPWMGRTSQRVVQITVSVDGKTILQGSTSDDGGPDADDVWEYLNRIGLAPTGEFPGGESEELEEDGFSGMEITGDIRLSIRYGGQVDLKRIRLDHVPDATRNRVWRVNSSVVTKNFGRRLITRRMASQLSDQRIPD